MVCMILLDLDKWLINKNRNKYKKEERLLVEYIIERISLKDSVSSKVMVSRICGFVKVGFTQI